MKLLFTKTFVRDYRKLPSEVQRAADKQLGLLLSNSQHPSLNLKKMNDPRKIWEGRITASYRFTPLERRHAEARGKIKDSNAFSHGINAPCDNLLTGFTFQIENNTYVLRRVGTHDTLKNP